MAKVVLSIGSNIEPVQNVRALVRALAEEFSELSFSPVYESKAVGFAGDNFLNLVACVETDRSLAAIQRWCKAYEARSGRDLNAAKFTPRTIDIDILLYDQTVQQADSAQDLPQLPRAEITYNAFVLKPLADLLPHWRHPQLGETYQALWQQFTEQPQADEQRLWEVDFDWSSALSVAAN